MYNIFPFLGKSPSNRPAMGFGNDALVLLPGAYFLPFDSVEETAKIAAGYPGNEIRQ